MRTCQGLDALLRVEAVEIAQIVNIPTGETKPRLILRARTRKLAKEAGFYFCTLSTCPACGSPTEDGTPMCADPDAGKR